MTEFDAINRMLRYLGELPIPNDVAIDDLPEGHEAVMARIILEETSREEQEERWWFNKFTTTYVPNDSGYITLPDNVISLTSDTKYLKDGNDLYDVDNQTKIFETGVELSVIVERAFSDLPDTFQTYVVLVAAKHLHVYLNGDETTQKELERRLSIQRIKLEKENMRQNKYNLMSGARLLDRGSNPTALI